MPAVSKSLGRRSSGRVGHAVPLLPDRRGPARRWRRHRHHRGTTGVSRRDGDRRAGRQDEPSTIACAEHADGLGSLVGMGAARGGHDRATGSDAAAGARNAVGSRGGGAGVDAGRRSAPRAHRSRVHARRWEGHRQRQGGSADLPVGPLRCAHGDSAGSAPCAHRAIRLTVSSCRPRLPGRARICELDGSPRAGTSLLAAIARSGLVAGQRTSASARRISSSAISPIRTSWRRSGAGRKRSDLTAASAVPAR